MKNYGMRVMGYASVNALSETPKNMELVDQAAIITEYAAERGWDLIKVFQEVKTSNNDLVHTKLEEVIKAAANNEFDVLLIARLDRLTRNIRHLNAIIEAVCIKNTISLVSVSEGLDTTLASGQLAINIIDIVTKWDTKRISDRTREIIARKREKGERVGHAPYGFTYKNKKLVEVTAEQDTIRLIKGKREAGMSYHQIAKTLNQKKITSKRGGIWYAETIKTVYQSADQRLQMAADG